MLTVGLTGGIGSGKSTVAHVLSRLGATVVDGDAVAREVVEPGTAALARLADRFGPDVLRPDGALDRAALAAVVFPDPAALADLDAITGPAIAARVTELRAAVPVDRISVFDMPLLVERGLWTREHLTVVVGADVETRVRRLVAQRGLSEDDARHRIAVQVTDDERRVAADVWLDNDGDVEQTRRRTERLWHDRLVPYEANLQAGTPSPRPGERAVVVIDPTWPAQGARLVAKLRDALGGLAHDVQHIGSTSLPGLPAEDVLDLQVGVRRLTDADEEAFVTALRRRGFARVESVVADTPHPDGADPGRWSKRFFAAMDPGRAANVHVREIGSPGWEFALAFRDWLRADQAALAEYAARKRRLAATTATTAEYATAKQPWFADAYVRLASTTYPSG